MTTSTKTRAEQAFDFVTQQIDSGRTVVISSMTKAWSFGGEAERAWVRIGLPAFRMRAGKLEMRQGRRRDTARYVVIASGDTILNRIASR